MNYHIIGFFIYQHSKYVIVKLICVCTTKRFNRNTCFWQALFTFILVYSLPMAVSHNIRFYFGRIVPKQVFIRADYFEELNISRYPGCLLVTTWGRLDFFCRFCVSLFLNKVATSITIILFSNVIPFNFSFLSVYVPALTQMQSPYIYPFSYSLICLIYMFL